VCAMLAYSRLYSSWHNQHLFPFLPSVYLHLATWREGKHVYNWEPQHWAHC
jgi:hypothetical protein